MNNPEYFKLPLFWGSFVLFFLLETLFKARFIPTSRLQRYSFHIVLTILNTVITRLVVLAPIVSWILWVRDSGFGIINYLSLPLWGEVIVSILVYDALNYWWHRMNHELPFLWRFHQVHHWDRAVDLGTALRFHPVEFLLSYAYKAVWVFIWGPSLLTYFCVEMAITIFAMFHHANWRLPKNWDDQWQGVLMTPKLHASHHTEDIRTRSANYSTILTVWDRLWKTYERPEEQSLNRLGLPGKDEGSLNFWEMLCIPFRREHEKT